METNESNLIKGADIRKNPALLCNMPMVGLCKCWADRETLELILEKLNLAFEDVGKVLGVKDNLYCIYVGETKNTHKRIENDHLKIGRNKGRKESSLRRRIKEKFNFENNKKLLNDFMDKLYYEVIAEENHEKVKNDLLRNEKGNFYLLNKKDNKHPLAKIIKNFL